MKMVVQANPFSETFVKKIPVCRPQSFARYLQKLFTKSSIASRVIETLSTSQEKHNFRKYMGYRL